jgi:D-xylose 1-dehydrogenase (NADP+, D-xylono-1,5-lactone-forming)
MSKILNWGILSTARINTALIRPLKLSTRNTLLGVASRSLEKGRVYAHQHHIPRYFGSYADLLADPEIDVIYNPLPNHLHLEWTLRAIKAGKHVLCEKPMVLLPEEVDLIQTTAREHGKIVTEAFMYRHHPQTMAVQDIVGSGELGELRFMRGSFSFNLTNSEDIRMIKEYGGGSIWDIGCYPLSYMRMLAGAQPINFSSWKRLSPSGVDISITSQLEYGNHLLGIMDCSFNAASHMTMEVRGTQGTLLIPTPFKPIGRSSIYVVNDGKQKKYSFTTKDLYLGEVEDIASAVLEGATPRISLSETRDNIATINAVLNSAHTIK